MADIRAIVVGGGRVGRQTARSLHDQGHSVVVVEEDADRCAELADEYVATVIEGDATNPNVLRQANLEEADVVAGLTGKRGINLGVCMLAQRLGDVRTVVRVDAAEAAAGYEDIVDDVVFPERLGALSAVNAITGIEVNALEDVMGDLDIYQITVAEGAPVAGKTLDDVGLPRGSLVVSTADGDRVAGRETVLEADRAYLVAVEPDVADEVMQLFRG
ncbi:MAG: TrkA family potassium uptake protein [Haloferacaceae archaeon]